MTEPDTHTDKPELSLTLKIVALVIIVIGLVGVLVPALSVAVWVGSTDLEIQFAVTDAITNQPIPRAIIHIRVEEEGSCEELEERSFTLRTDQNGYARRMMKRCTSAGRSGLLEDTYSVYLPYWSFHASATEYADSQDEELHTPEFAHAAKRGPPFATLLVPIRLEKIE